MYSIIKYMINSVQLLSHVQLVATPWTAARQASLSITNSWSWWTYSNYVHQVGDGIQPSHPLLSPSPPAFNLSQNQGLFKWVSSSHQVAQSIGVSSGLISFRMEWLDLLAVQGTLKSLLQHHSSKVSILLHSTFFIVQLSHPYMWRVWKGKKKDTERWSAHVGRCPICYWRSVEK